MSYTAYVKNTVYRLPPGFGVVFAGWLYINYFGVRPPLNTRQISAAEYAGTPTKYLLHPDHFPVAFPKVPGMKHIPNYREELFAKAHYKDASELPSHGHH